MTKKKTNNKIALTARSKVNSIKNIISKALIDSSAYFRIQKGRPTHPIGLNSLFKNLSGIPSPKCKTME